MKRIGSVFSILVLALFLNGCNSSSDDTDAISGTGDETTTTTTSDSTTKKTTAGQYSKQDTYKTYGVRNGGRQAWRIPKKGPGFGNKIKVVFSDGHTVVVNDTSHNYRESDGFVFKPGLGRNGEGVNNTGTAHGGVYLHAPYGNRSKQVTFYYN